MGDFGKELRRPFEVSEHCFDCVEFYGEGHGTVGCNAWPASKPFRCADYFPLPTVGIDGQTGQVFPPSRMQGRKEPREIGGPEPAYRRTQAQAEPESIEQTPTIEPTADPTDGANHRTPSPASRPGPDGKRFCACGVKLSKGKRLCGDCRAGNRRQTLRTYMQNYRKQAPPAVVGTGQDSPFAANSTHAE